MGKEQKQVKDELESWFHREAWKKSEAPFTAKTEPIAQKWAIRSKGESQDKEKIGTTDFKTQSHSHLLPLHQISHLFSLPFYNRRLLSKP